MCADEPWNGPEAAYVAVCMDNPNPAKAAWSVLSSMARTKPPRPLGTGSAVVTDYGEILAHVAERGPRSLLAVVDDLKAAIVAMSRIDPDLLGYWGALGFWIDLYNAGALALAGRSSAEGERSVLRIPGGFSKPFVTVDDEPLSLDAIEHGKVRRFRDPRIHTALVCGSISCPVLSSKPFSESDLDVGLDEQVAGFLAAGGAAIDRDAGGLRLSRVFSWFSGDFVRPHRMPTLLPGRTSDVLAWLMPYLESDLRSWIRSTEPDVGFQSYDRGLRCSVGS